MAKWSLVPAEYGYGWQPYAWLIYLTFLFIEPILAHASAATWARTLAEIAVFLVLYFAAFRVRGWLEYAVPIGMMALGVVEIRYNGGATAYFIFAAAALAWAEPLATAWIRLIVQVAITVVALLLLGVPFFPAFIAVAFTGFVGATAVRARETKLTDKRLRAANERVAAVAERERIARDLHDVLGHTLSLIVLKSELAARLCERGDPTAIDEVREVERVAREALSDVRGAISGYRVTTLEAELEAARTMLAAAGVIFRCDAQAIRLETLQERVLALALREAVTNVARHAGARSCAVEISADDVQCELHVRDDGSAGDERDGAGLQGMRERVEALGGSVVRERSHGTHLWVRLPLAT